MGCHPSRTGSIQRQIRLPSFAVLRKEVHEHAERDTDHDFSLLAGLDGVEVTAALSSLALGSLDGVGESWESALVARRTNLVFCYVIALRPTWSIFVRVFFCVGCIALNPLYTTTVPLSRLSTFLFVEGISCKLDHLSSAGSSAWD